jgi:poly-gamma-glutamate capsule biosynthesis protein CapA/YwtB (metallophosphatase superfamily)
VGAVRLFLCGDVMTGRGIDQVLPHPGDPALHESFVRDARVYVQLAERAHGPIARGVPFAHPWGDALGELERVAPDARIINLETAVTSQSTPWPAKGVHYRMHPANAPIVAAADIDCCVLANNHVLDWGHAGLLETLDALQPWCRTCGAGRDMVRARAPAELDLGRGGRVLVFSVGSSSSGIPSEWAASEHRAGVWLVDEHSADAAEAIAAAAAARRRPGDLVVVSVHWGGNWGYAIPLEQRSFAHRLIDSGVVDLVHGHSSHHVKGFEVHAGKLVLYGCGDFLTDYEGIGDHEHFRGDLSLMFFPLLDATSGRLLELHLTPMRTKRFQVRFADAPGRHWLLETLARECAPFAIGLELTDQGALRAHWR